MEVLDIAGQEEYKALGDQWIRESDAFLLIYSIASRATFDRVERLHQQVLRVKNSKAAAQTVLDPHIANLCYVPEPTDKSIVVLIGNKSDKVTERKVSTQEGFAMAAHLGCGFYECSARNDVNVEKPFAELVRKLRAARCASQPSCTQEPPLPKPKLHLVPLDSDRGLSVRLFWKLRPTRSTNTELSIAEQNALNRGLVEAARRDKKRTVKALIARGADLNGQPGVDGAAVHAAAAVGHTKMVNLILKEGAAINAKGPRDITALQLAAVEGHSAVVDLLLAKGTPVDTSSGLHGTALMAATSRAKLKLVRIFNQAWGERQCNRRTIR